ncbi:hypothetical protein QA811_43245 [Streptomyces sp. B21-102]|uniref:hypothetical protein n=1 Tax=unclassified Streptomyces TaxID=2593676 RepID=UPI002FF2320B
MKLQKCGRRSRRHSSLVALFYLANEHTVTAIACPHGAAPSWPFAFPLLARDLTAKVPVEFRRELFDGQMADAEALQ